MELADQQPILQDEAATQSQGAGSVSASGSQSQYAHDNAASTLHDVDGNISQIASTSTASHRTHPADLVSDVHPDPHAESAALQSHRHNQPGHARRQPSRTMSGFSAPREGSPTESNVSTPASEDIRSLSMSDGAVSEALSSRLGGVSSGQHHARARDQSQRHARPSALRRTTSSSSTSSSYVSDSDEATAYSASRPATESPPGRGSPRQHGQTYTHSHRPSRLSREPSQEGDTVAEGSGSPMQPIPLVELAEASNTTSGAIQETVAGITSISSEAMRVNMNDETMIDQGNVQSPGTDIQRLSSDTYSSRTHNTAPSTSRRIASQLAEELNSQKKADRRSRGDSARTTETDDTMTSMDVHGHGQSPRRLGNGDSPPAVIANGFHDEATHAARDTEQLYVSTSEQKTANATTRPTAGSSRSQPLELAAEHSRHNQSVLGNGQQGSSSGVANQLSAIPSRERERTAAAEQERDRETERAASSRRQLGEWTLGKTLGAGSMGKVKLGVSTITGEKFAIKIVPRFTSTAAAKQQNAESSRSRSKGHATGSNTDAVGTSSRAPTESFLAKAYAKDLSKEVRTTREASISLLLHHPYVTGMKSMLVYPNHYYMVFEYVNGGQMLDYIISHGRLRERSARKFAHLKIENILISKTGNIKIIDFGLSNLYSPHSHLSTFCGSLYFAAPELLNAKVYTGPEVDVWSFGIVLYVLVCGKVPFDDQSMPALHAKIKRGQVEYPAWLSTECRHLLSRMLVTTPSNRATLAEVANHPWITKGYDGAPSSHMPFREPLRHGELDPTVIAGMTGFEFGTAAETEAKLNEVLTSDAYVNALSQWDETRNGRNAHGSLRSPDSPHDFDSLKVKSPNRRFSGFGFYGKKLAGNVAAAFGGSKTDENAGDPFGLGSKSQLLGAARKPDILDPTKAFHPLLSIYYLVKEKMDRDKIYGPGVFASSTLSLMGPPAPPPLSTLAGVHTNVDHGRLGLGKPVNVSLAAPPTAAIAGRGSMVQPAPTPSWPRPLANGAVSSNANYDEADESSMQRTNSQQRSRRSPTHAFSAPNTPAVLQGGFRRTAAPTEPTKPHTRPHSSTPASQHRHSMHIPPDSGNDGLGTSAPPSSTAYALPPQNEEQATASSQPPTLVKRFGSILGRSDDKDRKKSQRNSLSLSGSWMGLKDRSVSAGPPPATSTLQEPVPMSPDLDVSLAAPSAPATIVRSSTTGSTLFPTRGHARGMSVDTANQPGSTPAGRRQFSLGGSASMRRPKTAGGVSGEHVTEEDENEVQLQPDESDLQNAASTAAEVKPVYLKGLFSVSTTSTKSPALIRESIATVLDRLNVSHRSIKAGFECAHAPSIDLSSVAFSPRPDPSDKTPVLGSSPESPTLDRRRSVRKSGRMSLARSPFGKDRDSERDTANSPPRHTGGIESSQNSLAPRPRPTTSSSGSFTMPTHSSGVPGSPAIDREQNTMPPASPDSRGQQFFSFSNVQAPMQPGDMVVRFEIFIVKIPWVPGLHGIQFRRISGSAWQYSQLARTILAELKL
ncbi:Serine/threonine-protein kinase [Cystobasidiomycetes sp. EMM_F5]